MMKNAIHDNNLSYQADTPIVQWINPNNILGCIGLAYILLSSQGIEGGLIGSISFMTVCISVLALNINKEGVAQSITSSVVQSIFLSVSLLALVLSIEAIIFSGSLSINLITQLNILAILLLSVIILSVVAIFKLSFQLRQSLSYYSSQIKIAIALLIGAILITSTYTTAEHTILSTIVLASYFLILEVFHDQKRPNIIWLILWTIVLGSYISMIIFHIEKNILQSAQPPLLDAFSLFSLVFFISGLLYVPLAYFNDRLAFLPTEWNFTLTDRSLLRNRIQFSILITLVFCFATIGIVSIFQIRSWDIKHGDNIFQQEFIQALMNTYVFLFLIGLVISIWLSEYIRTPLIKLGNTMRKAKLSQGEQIIKWDGNDEIADLIREYNNMIEKLQDNASLLAQSERESAWREMSKQVAHEIKNPLTPMKLSLQHLQHSISLQRDNIEELTLRMSSTLMNQIENLRQIADEFSNFGSLPKTNNKKVLLNDIVETIHDLFRQRSDMDIRLVEPIDDIGAYADKNHLLRILNNLVKNSIQAIPADRKGEIILRLYKEHNKAIISVSDNGAGISEEMQSKIFRPKFTTKSSGSGLGLAIAANMVDSIGGRIYFESQEEVGTSFFVELPLIRSVYSPELERVTL